MSLFGLRGLLRTGAQIIHGEIMNALDAVDKKEEAAWQGNLRGRTVYVLRYNDDLGTGDTMIYASRTDAADAAARVEQNHPTMHVYVFRKVIE